MCFYRNNHHAAIVLCPRVTHRYAITMNTSSRCVLTHALTIRLDRQHGITEAMFSIETLIMLSSMTHHVVFSTDTSPHRHVSQMRSSLRCRLTHTHLMLSSSCYLDWHIVMLSKMNVSCVFYTRGVKVRLVCSPQCPQNEDFGRRNKRWNADVRLAS